jgi:Cu2+-exporting ATPase
MFKKKFWISLIFTIPIVLFSQLESRLFGLDPLFDFAGQQYVQLGLSTILFIYGGWPFVSGMISELKSKSPGMMTLISVALVTAYGYSSAVVFGLRGEPFFWELATLISVMLLGHWIEMSATIQAGNALESLAKLLPETALKLGDGDESEVEIAQLQKGDHVKIKPGQKIPIDGIIIEGSASIDESMLTGESKPTTKSKGAEVVGGSINQDGILIIEVSKINEDTYLSQVIQLVRNAQNSKSKLQTLADRVAFWLTIVALSISFITFVVWWVINPSDIAFAIARAVTVLVIACPHALGVAIPLVVARSTSIASKNGFLIRNRTTFEKAYNANSIVFDKTGTLTKGVFEVTDVQIIGDSLDKNHVLHYAQSLEANSDHPIAKGITQYQTATKLLEVTDFRELTGEGVEGTIEGKIIKIVSPGYLKRNEIKAPEELNQKEQSQTIVIMLVDNQVSAIFALGDSIRSESKVAIQSLHEMGIESVMLTGDNQQVANKVASQLGIDTVFAEVLPDQKSQKIQDLQQGNKLVVMVGDGVNDAPALATANIGIAIGAGTDVAIETADIILVRNNPLDVTKVIQLSKRTHTKIVQNLWWAAGYNIIAVPLAAGILFPIGITLSPAIGGLLMALSTVIVSVNAQRLSI